MIGYAATIYNLTDDLIRCQLFYGKLDQSIIDQYSCTLCDILYQVRIGNGNSVFISGHFLRGQDKLLILF